MRDGGSAGGREVLLLPGLLLVIGVLHVLSGPVRGQTQPPSQQLLINAASAATWTEGASNIVQLDGGVTIELDRAKVSAKRAVVWLGWAPNGQPGEQAATIALLDDARIEQGEVKRSGDRLVVTARVNGTIRITANKRIAESQAPSPLYQQALALRLETEAATAAAAATMPTTIEIPPPTTTAPTTQRVRRTGPISYHAANIDWATSEGKLAPVLSEGVAITRQQPDGSYLEMQAQRAVLFTTLASLHGVGGMQQMQSIEDAISAVYLEGDVRIVVTPAHLSVRAEQRLEANRVYYDFTTDRAVLTDAIIHTVDAQRGIPIIVRARTVRQMSQGEYHVNQAELSTSSFAVPSYSIRTDKAYIREEETGDPRYGTRTVFVGHDVTFNAYHVPWFYLPALAGVFTEHGMALRDLQFGNSRNFGWYLKTEWGLLETFGELPPPDLDLSYHLDYYGDRGPAGGIDGKYGGGFISQTTKQPLNFNGQFESYFVNDDGFDTLGHHRGKPTPPDKFRGMAEWEHQHFFPDDWQLQLRTGWVSDATFREEWFEDEFNDGLPMESSLYLKHQRDTAAITLLATVQPNNVVTNADFIQEQFEIERLPQLAYRRIGDSLFDDRATLFSDNTVERVRFNMSGADLGKQGFRFNKGVKPGIPSLGVTGQNGVGLPAALPEDWNDRADLRQELDFPFPVGQFKVLPYVMGRYTYDSQSPGGGEENRGFVGTGVRVNTQFWKVDDAPESELFDIHRVRHIIEPEVHLWTSATNVDPNHLFLYDEAVDKTWDTSAASVALRQRWETKRGGPGNWRSVEFLSLNVEADFYANKPSAAELPPGGFRGLFFPSLPEVSIPRNSINADARWRISDTTILQSDLQYNMDTQDVATASIGLIEQRNERLTCFLGLRYIGELDSNIATIAASYQLTPKYSVGIRESFDFGNQSDVYSSVSLLRKFDRFFVLLTVYRDENSGESGFSFGLFPEGLGRGASSDAVQNIFGKK